MRQGSIRSKVLSCCKLLQVTVRGPATLHAQKFDLIEKRRGDRIFAYVGAVPARRTCQKKKSGCLQARLPDASGFLFFGKA